MREAPQREWRASRAAKRRDTMALKPSEVRDMSEAELHARELELVDELFHLRLRRATSQLPNPMKVRETRRNLARVKTMLRARTLRGGTP